MKWFVNTLRYSTVLISLLSMSACSEKQQLVEQKVTPGTSSSSGKVMSVYKSPTCGCCGEWITHIEGSGFTSQAFHPNNLDQLKIDLGVMPKYQSCHTAISSKGYVFEGHVPAKFIQMFLENPPEGALGLAVPGMPLGSPGMEVDDRFTPYEVLLLHSNGSAEIYARINTREEQFN